MNAAAGQLALECKLRGVNSTVNHRDASPLSALTMACDLLELGRADALLVGAVDELSAPALAGYRTLGAGGACVLGEGAGMLLLEREDDAVGAAPASAPGSPAAASAATIAPRVGWGHPTTTDSWPEAARAVREAAAGRRIDAVVSGANGSAYDAHEAAALRAGLGAAPPSTSMVARIGESFSSAIQRLLAAVHLLERDRAVERVLVPAFAQGGANIAVVLERS